MIYRITTTLPGSKLFGPIMVERKRRDSAALYYEFAIYDRLSGCGLLDRPIAEKSMKAARNAYRPNCYEHETTILNWVVTFERIKD